MNARFALLTLAATLGLGDVAAAQQPEPDSLNPVHALDKAALANFVELPLFDPARRLPPPEAPPPPVAVVAPPPPPPVQPPAIQLIGIIRGQRDMAIVHENGGAKTVILRNGEVLDGWTVVVKPLGVTLKNGDRSVDFAIFASTAGGTTPPGSTPLPFNGVAPNRPPRRQRDM